MQQHAQRSGGRHFVERYIPTFRGGSCSRTGCSAVRSLRLGGTLCWWVAGTCDSRWRHLILLVGLANPFEDPLNQVSTFKRQGWGRRLMLRNAHLHWDKKRSRPTSSAWCLPN